MEVALEQHNSLLTSVIGEHGGVVVTSRGEGDSFFAVFPSAAAAVEAAGACQLRLGGEDWPTGAALRVRMGLHTGEARVHGSDRVDHVPINRCARVKAAAHGGQVLVTRATRDLAGGRLGGGFGLKRLGEFRLRDLAEPELIYQLTHAGLPADFPPIRTLAERTGNLPVPVSSFIGRERELEQTAAALGEARMVALTGPGGVGKTRLALQVASQVVGRFGDGAWLCELAPIRDPAGVDDAVAAVFSVTARAGQSTREALVEFLRGKELLLVLDNCEHLIEGVAALAGALARACERLVILATSREALWIEGERLVPVPPLGVPGVDADLAAITDAAAGWDRAGGRARGGAGARDDRARAGAPAGAQLRGARGWSARCGGAAPDAASGNRLVVRAAGRARTGPAGPAGGVRRRCHLGGGRGGLRRGGYRPRCGVRGAGGPGGAVACGGRGKGARDPLPAAGDDPPVRRGTPRGSRGDNAVAGPSRRLLPRPPPAGSRPRPRP